MCEHDCNSNGIVDACDITTQQSCDVASGVSEDSDSDGTPDECDPNEPPLPTATLVSIVSWKDHANQAFQNELIGVDLNGHVEDAPLNPTVTSEPRMGGITELRAKFNTPLIQSGPNAVTIFEQLPGASCPGGSQAAYCLYSGAASYTASIEEGDTLVLRFTPGLENVRTYKIRVNTSVTRKASQVFEVRCLTGDVNDSGLVNATDRSVVLAVWTGPGYSAKTDLNLSGATNAGDRSVVVGAWTGTGTNCAP